MTEPTIALTTDRDPAPDPGERGRLDVADRVIERIATIAAGEVPGVLACGSALDGALGRQYPKADAEVAGDRVTVAVGLAVAWPSPLADTAAAVRRRVADRLTQLVGLHVDTVAVTIDQVRHQQAATPRRVR
ncbi:MAG TPA: Asp23/Gls24 family envelope stress response protein [Dermatophilaceae bacterium]|nr:Asp23/Gls24 family envelope stress response protein [Dermatophilaceae bacterium]